jgi:hypothetical protein
MKIAVVLNTHEASEVFFDTLDSIRAYMSEDVLVVVDGFSWPKFKHVDMPAHKVEGFLHGHRKSPYRNVTLGLMKASQIWPDADWYCYLEYDCLVGSNAFLQDLKTCENLDVWCVGNTHEIGNRKFPFLEKIVKGEIKENHQLLGCCVFYNKKFIKKLLEEDFFERFLYFTNPFSKGFFPLYEYENDTYDITEHIYPSLASHYGGKVGQFAGLFGTIWKGNYPRYPMRFRPDFVEGENFFEASILHPIKTIDHPLRDFYRRKRKNDRGQL